MEYAIEMLQITKRFGPVLANNHVDFKVKAGTIHALLGENGAGKSTLMSILSGLYRPDEGAVHIHEKHVQMRSPKDAIQLGIGMVHQNFRLVESFTATENLILGSKKEPIWQSRKWMKRKMDEVEHISATYGLRFPVDCPVWQLSYGEQQRVEIVKTLYRGADIIVLDEPTSVLTPGEVNELFVTLRRLTSAGKTVIITTHKLKEVMALSDEISVMTKGSMIKTLRTIDTNEQELARLMVGRDISLEVKKASTAPGKEVVVMEAVEAYGDHGRKALNGISLTIQEGEIVGVAGVAGNGQTELAEVLTGLRSWESGTLKYKGAVVDHASVRHFNDQGIASIPENRMKAGLAGGLGATDNLLMKSYRSSQRLKLGFMKVKENEEWAQELVKNYDIKTPNLETPVRKLSGGNQQKLLFAREMDRNPNLMVAMHPTQGLDVGATEWVTDQLCELRDKGSGILLISEDLDEILRLSDRIIVLFDGQIMGDLKNEEISKEHIGLLMAGATVALEEVGV